MSDLRPTALDDDGLQEALRSFITDYSSRYEIKVLLDQPQIHIPHLEPGIAMTILRIVQEALTNVVRHAHAAQVHVSLRYANEILHLTVQDDGVGSTIPRGASPVTG